jgi:hypothetical protein
MHETLSAYVRSRQNALYLIKDWLRGSGRKGRNERLKQLRSYFRFKSGKIPAPEGFYLYSPNWTEVTAAIDAWLDPIAPAARGDEWPFVQHVGLVAKGELARND